MIFVGTTGSRGARAILAFALFAIVLSVIPVMCGPSFAFAENPDVNQQTPTALIAGDLRTTSNNVTAQVFDDETTAVPNDALGLQHGTYETSTLEGEEPAKWFFYSPAESGGYAFESAGIIKTDDEGEEYEETNGDMFGALYERTGDTLTLVASDDDGGVSGNFSIVTNLEQGKVYYLACSANADLDVDFRVRVTKFEFDAHDLGAYTVNSRTVLYAEEAESAQKLSENLAIELRSPFGDVADFSLGTEYTVSWYLDEWSEENDESGERVAAQFPADPGEYLAVIEGVDPYVGELIVHVSLLDGHDLSIYGVDYAAEVRDGFASSEALLKALEIKFFDARGDGEKQVDLQIDVDYELSGLYLLGEDGGLGDKIEGIPSNPGDYVAVVSGVGEYTGVQELPFTMYSSNDISRYYPLCNDRVLASVATNAEALLDALDIQLVSPYDESTVVNLDQLTVSGWYNGESGAENPEALTFPATAGDYYVVLEGANPYMGSKPVYFTIYDDGDLAYYGISGVTRVQSTLDSEAAVVKALDISFSDPDSEADLGLEYGKDFEVLGWYSGEDYGWEDASSEGKLESFPTQVGSFVVELGGIGKYSGKVAYAFEMCNPNDISFAEVSSAEYVSTDNATSAASLLSALGITVSNPVGEGDLTLGVDYAVSGFHAEPDDDFEPQAMEFPAQPGSYYVTLGGIGSYTGAVDVYFTVKEFSSLEEATIEGVQDEYTLGSEALIVNSSVRTAEGDELEEGYHYVVEIQDVDAACAAIDSITKPGAYRIVVTGIEEAGYTGSISKDFIVKAEEVVEGYTVTWMNDDGTILESIDGITDDSTLEYSGETPCKEADVQYVYEFARWYRVPSDVSDDVTYIAAYTASPREYTVEWQNDDGSLIERVTLRYGEVPQHASPEKEGNAQYSYLFEGWTPEPVVVSGDAVYKAVFTELLNTYSVTWKNEDGTVLEVDEDVAYGTLPSFDSEAPTKAEDEQYTYEHDGWEPAVSEVSGNAVYTAVFKQVKKSADTPDNPGDKPEPTSPGSTESEQGQPAQVGMDLKDGAVSYVVMKSGANPEVQFTKTSAASSVVVPNTVVVKGVTYKVTSIAANAFKGSKKLKKVVVGDNIVSIGRSAFQNCPKLKSVVLGINVKSIGKKVFAGDKKLKSITVKSGKLTKSSAKNIIKGSKIKKVKLSGKAAKAKKKSYKKFFGKRVKVK